MEKVRPMEKVGPVLPGWVPRPAPEPVVLPGRWCRLEPISPAHADDLYAASVADGADDRFRYLFEDVPDRPAFDAWLTAAQAGRDPLTVAVLDALTGRCGGRQSLIRITPEFGVIELGSILWGPGVARTRIATEALYLTARHVFDDLGYRRFEWKCDSLNAASRQAALRFGFRFEGTFRQHMVVKGRNRDTAWYAITDDEWPQLREAYQRWLDPSNFDPDGAQRSRLVTRR